MVLNEIYNFLKSFSHIISDEDKTKLINIQSHLKYGENQKIINSKYGSHFDDCPWSNDNTTCGRDTCRCILYRLNYHQVENEARKIMNFYNRYKCKNCSFK